MRDTVGQHKLQWRSGFAIQHEKRTINRSLRIAVRLHLDPFRIFRLPDNQRATLLLRPAQRSRSDREIAAIELHVQLRIREIDPPCRIPDRRQLHLCPSRKAGKIKEKPLPKGPGGRGGAGEEAGRRGQQRAPQRRRAAYGERSGRQPPLPSAPAQQPEPAVARAERGAPSGRDDRRRSRPQGRGLTPAATILPAMRIRSYLLLTACLLLAGGLAGCGRSGSAVYCEPVDPCGWQPGDTLRIVHHNTDTVGRYDIELFASWAPRLAALHGTRPAAGRPGRQPAAGVADQLPDRRTVRTIRRLRIRIRPGNGRTPDRPAGPRRGNNANETWEKINCAGSRRT